ncbi:MAG: radical SAM protein [archaeon]
MHNVLLKHLKIIKGIKEIRPQINSLKLISDFRKTPKKLPKPSVIIICPFDFCNLRCRMCDTWKNKKDYDFNLSNTKIKQFLIDTKEYFGNDIIITFTGGEIFQDKSIFELFHHTKNLGFPMRLDTNATLLIEEYIDQLILQGIEMINISIDGYSSKTHDLIRGIKGSYDLSMQAIDNLHKKGFAVSINTVMMKENIHEIMELLSHVNSSGKIKSINIMAIMPRDFRNKEEISQIYPDEFRKDAIELIDEIVSKKIKVSNPTHQLLRYRQFFMNPLRFVKNECNIGMDYYFLDRHLNLNICPFLPQVSLNNRSIKDVWESLEMRYFAALKKQCRTNCRILVNCYDE